MLSDSKDFKLSLVVSMGYCIKVVSKGGQGGLLLELNLLNNKHL